MPYGSQMFQKRFKSADEDGTFRFEFNEPYKAGSSFLITVSDEAHKINGVIHPIKIPLMSAVPSAILTPSFSTAMFAPAIDLPFN
jgi:hypothetical protein